MCGLIPLAGACKEEGRCLQPALKPPEAAASQEQEQQENAQTWNLYFASANLQKPGGKKQKKNPYHPSFTNKQVTNKHTKRRPEGTCQHRVGHPMQDGEHNPPAYLALRFCNQISEIIHLPTSPGLWPKGIKRLNSIKSKRDF